MPEHIEQIEGHHHHHHHHDDHDWTEANKAWFDQNAGAYDDKPSFIELAKRLSKFILKEFPFDEEKTSLMDYACGTGLLAREFAPYTKVIVGVDISQKTVDQFNLRVANQGIDPSEMRAVCTKLKGTDDELDGLKFDYVTCTMAYHHFDALDEVTRTLAHFLKPGGSLIIADLIKREGIFDHRPDVHHIVPHKGGFSEEDMTKLFEGAGLKTSTFKPAFNVIHDGHELQIFLATAVKDV